MSSRGKRGTGILIHLARGESGYATLIAVLVLLVLGALVITPILLYMNTGLEAGQTHERRTDELYAADAGVDYALWHIKMGQVLTKGDPGYPPGDDPEDYPKQVFQDGFPINDKDVEVTVWEVLGEEESEYPAYRIVSVARSDLPPPDDDTYTTVESYVTLAYSTISLLDAAITVRENGTIKGEVVGDVICGGNLDILAGGKVDGNVLCAGKVQIFPGSWVTGDVRSGQGCDNKGRVDGTIYPPDPEIEIPQVEDKYWPDAGDVSERYGGEVNKSDPYLPEINVASTSSIGPRYIDGPLDIYKKKSGGTGDTLTLTGTVYVTGPLSIGKTGEDFKLNLNGQAIFCEYLDTEQKHPAIEITDRCTIKGPGCIIAVGNIDFWPKMATGGEEDCVILMSINGTTDLHPQGDFYGAVLGDVKMDVFPAGGKVTYVAPEPGDDLNFPIFNTAQIVTYNIYNSDIYGITASP